MGDLELVFVPPATAVSGLEQTWKLWFMFLIRGEVPSLTSPSLRQVFSSPKYIASLVVQSSLANKPKLSTRHIRLAGQFMTSRPGRRRRTILAEIRRAESWTRNGFTDWGWDLSIHWIWEGISGYCGTNLIPVTRTEIKEGMCFCKSPKSWVGAAGWSRDVTEDFFAKRVFKKPANL